MKKVICILAHKTADSSVGRASDCSWFKFVFGWSLVRLRLGGTVLSAPVAQLAARKTSNLEVAGSNPVRGFNYFFSLHLKYQ